MNVRGFSLIESLIALFLLGVTIAAILPAFLVQMDANAQGEIRSGAISAAQQRLEALRLADPESLNDPIVAGDPALETEQINIGGIEYDVRTRYCDRPEFCPPASPGSRHLTIEVIRNGRVIYTVETVYTQLL